MRALALLVILLLAGCAEQGPSPPTGGSPPTPTAPTTEEPWRETHEGWTLTVDPGVIEGAPGDRVEVEVRLEGPRGAEGTLAVDREWMDPSRPRIPVLDGRANLTARVHLAADERLAAFLTLGPEGNDQPSVAFAGPPIRLAGVQRELPLEQHTEVSDHAPGLSVEVEGSAVRVVFAARENATTTADEAVRADGPLLVAQVGGETRLVLFVTRGFNDAVSPFPEPRRTRVETVVPDLPPGEVRVLALTSVACFCYEFDPPELHEQRVVIG